MVTLHGSHRLEQADDDGCTVTTELEVESSVPGVEEYLVGHLDDEIANIERALDDWLAHR
jgi:hypothetical protein